MIESCIRKSKLIIIEVSFFPPKFHICRQSISSLAFWCGFCFLSPLWSTKRQTICTLGTWPQCHRILASPQVKTHQSPLHSIPLLKYIKMSFTQNFILIKRDSNPYSSLMRLLLYSQICNYANNWSFHSNLHLYLSDSYQRYLLFQFSLKF